MMVFGAPSVTTTGASTTPPWCADNSAMPELSPSQDTPPSPMDQEMLVG